MPDQKNPETSTVRSALAVTAAVDDLLRPGRDGCVLDADTAVAALVALIDEVRALRPHQARDVVDHLEARLAAGALSPRSQAIRVPPGVPITVYNVGQHSGAWPDVIADPDYWPVPRSDPDDDPDAPEDAGNQPIRRNNLGNIEVAEDPDGLSLTMEPTTAEGADDDLTDDVDDMPAGSMPDTLDPADPWGTEDERAQKQPPEPGEDAPQPRGLSGALLDHDGKDERITAAVDELAARVNAEPEA